MSVAMQGLTSADPCEMCGLLDMLASSDSGTRYMHESVAASSPDWYTRLHCGWAC